MIDIGTTVLIFSIILGWCSGILMAEDNMILGFGLLLSWMILAPQIF